MLEYAPSPGLPVLIEAIQKYYDNLNMHFEKDEILITTGGSEALQICAWGRGRTFSPCWKIS